MVVVVRPKGHKTLIKALLYYFYRSFAKSGSLANPGCTESVAEAVHRRGTFVSALALILLVSLRTPAFLHALYYYIITLLYYYISVLLYNYMICCYYLRAAASAAD